MSQTGDPKPGRYKIGELDTRDSGLDPKPAEKPSAPSSERKQGDTGETGRSDAPLHDAAADPAPALPSGAPGSDRTESGTSTPGLPRPGRYKIGELETLEIARSIIVDPPVEMPQPTRRRYGRWFAYLVLAFFGAALAYDAVLFLLSLFAVSSVLGIAGSALLAAALVVGGFWVFDEMRRFYRTKTADGVREKAARLRGSANHSEAVELINQIMPSLGGNVAARESSVRLRARLQSTHDGADVMNLFAREVLDPLDRQAATRIARAARDTAVGVAASPVGALDAIIGTVRGLRLVREIATIYGLRPGTFGAMKLMKRALLDGGSFGTADLASDLWADVLSGLGVRAVGAVTGKLSEGVFAAVRMTRLGVATMQACRPIPFADEQRLNALRRELVTRVFTGLLPRRRRQELEPAPPS